MTSQVLKQLLFEEQCRYADPRIFGAVEAQQAQIQALEQAIADQRSNPITNNKRKEKS